MNKLTDLLMAVNESKIYLDGSDVIDWNLLEEHVIKDPKLKGIEDKEKIAVLLSVQKWLIDEHWALPGAFPDNQEFKKIDI